MNSCLINGHENGNSRRCDICNTDVHRASFVKLLIGIKPAEKAKSISSNLFKETNTTPT